jgi:Sep-tRNA:Cys-tRNA synthetase
MPTAAARDAKRIVMESLAMNYPQRKTVIVDSLAHYTTYLAIEANDLRVMEVPNSGYPEYNVILDNYEECIKECLKTQGNPPLLAVLTHVDYKYGNYNNPLIVGKICKEYGVPFLLNAAYSAGILPINCSNNHIDFIACSGHKSMSSSGPIGILGFSNKFYDDIMRASKIQGNLSSKTFPNKICSFMGCPPVYGAPLITLMASFPYIIERTQKETLAEERKKIAYIIEKIKDIDGIEILGRLPKIHPLTNIKTDCFAKVAKTHPRRGFFLREEFKDRKILGLAPGITKEMKFNTYGLSWPQIKYFINSFLEIAEKFHLI